MTVTAYLYGAGLKALNNKEIDWDSDTICVALCTDAYTPAQNTHDYFNDISGEMAASGGYTAGGGTLTGGSAVHASGTTTLYADNITWGTVTGTAHYAIVYDAKSGSAATNPLIGYINFGADVVSSGGNFTITWPPTGVAQYAVTLAS